MMRAIEHVIHLLLTLIPVLFILFFFSALFMWVIIFIVIADGIHIAFRGVSLLNEETAVFIQIYAFKCAAFIFCIGNVFIFLFV